MKILYQNKVRTERLFCRRHICVPRQNDSNRASTASLKERSEFEPQPPKSPAVRRAKRIRTQRSKSKANLSKRPKGVNQNPGHAPANQRAGFWRAQMARKPDSTYFVRAEGLERQLCRQNPAQRHPVWSLCTKKRHPKGCLFECISGRANYSADLTQENIWRILAPVVSIS